MSTSTHSLTPRQEQSITALLVQGSLQAAAEASGINEKTLRRWLREDAVFQIAYREARRQVVQQAIVQVQQATGEAVETLRKVMQAADAPASAKVSAAKTILETAVKAIELEDLEQRIVALETQQGMTR
jgi:predicted site-specific integrase-resolvase